MNRLIVVALSSVFMVACSEDNPSRRADQQRLSDSGVDEPSDGGRFEGFTDAGGADSGRRADVGPDDPDDGVPPRDAGFKPGDSAIFSDAGPALDGQVPADGGPVGDAQSSDAQASDGPVADAQPADGSPLNDAGPGEDAGEDAEAPAEDASAVDAAPPQDLDGDGVSVEAGDCDDGDPLRFPGNPEVCDGIDNDCDGEIDGLVRPCWDGADDGSEGRGLCGAGTATCVAGVFEDCRGQVLPAPELCDGLDNDCDGEVDNGCDEDLDGVTVAQGDCDDGDPEVNPNAIEICDGIDNNCDGDVDDLQRPCYEGPANTEGRGVCGGGQSTCVEGAFGECVGQTVPVEEVCDNGLDDNCDGQIDEGCEDLRCPAVDLDSVVEVSTGCVATLSSGQGYIAVRLRDLDGAPMMDADIRIETVPPLPLLRQRLAGDDYYRVFTAGNAPIEAQVRVTIGCADGQRIALSQAPMIRVVPGLGRGTHTQTGGCEDPGGNLLVSVTDAEEGAPIEGAWVLLNDADDRALQSSPGAGVAGGPPNRPNFGRTNVNGALRLTDFGDSLHGPQTLTVGADGFENVTFIGLGSSVVRVALRRVEVAAPITATLRGEVSNYPDLRTDGQVDAGLVLGSFDLPFISTLQINRLFSRSACWDPVQGGLFGGAIDPVPVPGNMAVPAQRERVLGFAQSISAHPHALTDVPLGVDHFVALTGKAPTRDVVSLLTDNGGLSELVGLLTMHSIGVARNVAVDGDRQLDIALSQEPLIPAACSVTGAPVGSNVFCVSAGDWSGANGTGDLFAMGIAGANSAEVAAAAPGSLELPLTVAPSAGAFSGVGYLGAVVAMFTEVDAPAALRGSVTAIIDRENLGPDGGTINADGFLTPTPLNARGRRLQWASVANASAPAPQICRAAVVRTIQERYNPGACSAVRAVTRELPLWTYYTAGDAVEARRPMLPAGWPRADREGLLDLDATPERDWLTFRISCMALGLAPQFSLSAGDYRQLVDGLTHVTVTDRRQ